MGERGKERGGVKRQGKGEMFWGPKNYRRTLVDENN